MTTNHRKMAGLLVLTFLTPALISGIHLWQKKKSFRDSPGIYKTDAQGERRSLGTLSYDLESHPNSYLVSSSYVTPEYDGKYASQVRKNLRNYFEWSYTLEYNRKEKTLTKNRYEMLPVDYAHPNQSWVWTNVEESAIHTVAAPMRALWNTPQKIDAYKGGNLSELKKYGAVLETVK